MLKDNRLTKTVNRLFSGKLVLLETSIMLMILSIGFLIRIFPLRWGLYLTEFDPWMQYKEFMYIVRNGWIGFIKFFSWHDMTSWYPFGRDVGRTAFPGLPFFAAFIYHSLHGLGIELNPLELAAFIPPLLSMVAIVFAYLLGRELGGKPAGLFSAFLLALSRAHVERSLLGWFDDECIGIPLMLIGIWAYIQAIKDERSWKGSIAYSIVSGFSLGYLSASWGAAKFPLTYIPLITVILALLGRYRRRLLTSFALTFAIYAAISVMVPKLGIRYLFETTLLSGFAALIILISFELSRMLPGGRHVRRLPYYVVGVGIAGFIALIALGLANLPGLKFFSVVVPTLRSRLPIVISVAENQISTWAIMFSDAGFQLLLALFGFYYALRRRADEDLILSGYAILTIYFSSTMVRLSTIMAPMVAVMAGFGVTEIIEGFSRNLKLLTRAKAKVRPISIEYYVLTPLLIVGLLTVNFIPSAYGFRYSISAIDSGYTPQTIVSASTPLRMKLDAWLNALEWMRNNLPEDAVVACWWDYGYWVTILGNRTSIVDNATLNSTQIGEIAYAFMSNETVAYRVFKKFGATHVLVFVTHYIQARTGGAMIMRLLSYGDEAKWIWMLRIANQEGHHFNESEYISERGVPTEKFWYETTIGQLIPYKPRTVAGGITSHVYEPPNLKHSPSASEASAHIPSEPPPRSSYASLSPRQASQDRP